MSPTRSDINPRVGFEELISKSDLWRRNEWMVKRDREIDENEVCKASFGII
jgi:hypothetical protein